jgi:hypothetical protein
LPIAEQYQADLYQGTGEISTTHLTQIARAGLEEGREVVTLPFTDFDPAGHQMAVSIAHKMRCFKELLYPDLKFRVVPASVTLKQAIELDLPSSPLKETERRASRWKAAWGREQTELDALIELQPDAFREIAHQAVRPYFDDTLDQRVASAKWAWREQAQPLLDDLVAEDAAFEAGAKRLGASLHAAAEPLEQAEKALKTYRFAYERACDDIEEARSDLELEINRLGRELAGTIPEFQMPEIELPDEENEPLVTSDMDLLDHIMTLRDRKAYANEAGR